MGIGDRGCNAGDCWNRALACAPCNSDKGQRLAVQATIEKAFEDGRIETEALKKEVSSGFLKRVKWAERRWKGIERQPILPIP